MQKLLRDVILLLVWASGARSNDQLSRDSASPVSILGALSNVSSTIVTTTTTTTTSTAITTTKSITDAPTSISRASIETNPSGNATCPYRTVNYITHTLPQQCLRTDRISFNSTSNAISDSATNSPASELSSSSSIFTAQTVSGPLTTTVAVSLDDSTSSIPDNAHGDYIHPTASSSVLAPASTQVTDLSSSSNPLVEIEIDSPLDNANFLSFEEWKLQNLAKAGQSPDNVGRAQPINAGRQRPGIDNVLDTFGDENEISLDFSGFGPHPPDSPDVRGVSTVNADGAAPEQPRPGSPELRSKDAGKTCKERTNYASFDCAANVLKSNSECKSASSVLVENKDSYMLNICSASNKYFIVELCDDILVDTLVLANYEFFSSSFRHFRISVSDRYPIKAEKWRELGTYEARNTREIQAFLVENPLIWARYLRIEFLTHYGNEYYCPVSLLRVHGTTMIQEYLHHEEISRGESNDEDTNLVGEAIAAPPVMPETAETSILPLKPSDNAAVDSELSETTTTLLNSLPTTSATGDRSVGIGDPTSILSDSTIPTSTDSKLPVEFVDTKPPNTASEIVQSISSAMTSATFVERGPQDASPPPASLTTRSVSDAEVLNSSKEAAPTVSVISLTETTSTRSSSSQLSASSTSQEFNGTGGSTERTPPGAATHNTSAVSSSSLGSSTPNHAIASTNTSRTVPATSTGSQQAQPSTQESFFKSVHKRLQQLESNSTLSLQYIEEQSRILRDAFSKVEKRQLSATTTFLTNLNQTVMGDLHGFRQAYDQLWQSTVIELEGQREQFQRDMLAMSSRLTLVADELVWQKRMGIVQSTLVLMCLALVLFGRSGNGGPLDLPIMQQMMHKSTAALRAGWESPPNSPSPASRSPVRLLRHRLWRSSTENVHLTDSDPSRPQSVDGPNVIIGPPTPGTPDALSDVEEHDADPIVRVASKGNPASPPQSKKRRKRRPSSAGRNGNAKVKSPLAYS